MENNGRYIDPYTPEWHAERIGKITSSEVHHLFAKGKGKDEMFGVPAMTYIDMKIGEVLTGTAKEARGEALEYGASEEQGAADAYSILTNQKLSFSGLYIHSDKTFGGTPDREIWVNGKLQGIIEIKCPFDIAKHPKICALKNVDELKKFQPQYYCQPQLNMLLTGAPWCDFISYDNRIKIEGLKIKIFRIEPDMEWRKEFEIRLNAALAIMESKIEDIFHTHKSNLVYRVA